MRRKFILPTASILLVFSMFLSGCSSSVIQVSEADQITAVSVTQPSTGFLVSGKLYTGKVQANQEMQVVPKLAGKIVSFPVEVGDAVKKGQTLFQIEDEDYKNSARIAKAAVGAAKAGVGTATVGHDSAVVQAQSGVTKAEAAVIQAESGMESLKHALDQLHASAEVTEQDLENAEQNLNRIKQLYDADAASKLQYEQAQTAVIKAKSAVESVKIKQQDTEAMLASAKQGLQKAKEGYAQAKEGLQIAQSNASVESVQQQLRQAEISAEIASDRLDDTVITAAFDGVVGKTMADVGDMVSPQDPVLVLADLHSVSVKIHVPVEEINEIQEGDLVEVSAIPISYEGTGTINSISPLDDNGLGYPVEILVENNDKILKDGMTAEVSFIPKGSKKGLLIHRSSLIEKDGKHFVFVAKDDRAILTEVKIEDQNDSEVLISGGITSEDKIITTNVSVLEDNGRIYIES